MNLGTLPVASHAARRYQIAHYPVALIDRVRLADARSVTVRPVLPQDVDALQAFVQRPGEPGMVHARLAFRPE